MDFFLYICYTYSRGQKRRIEMGYLAKKGSIIIAMLFAIVLSLVTVSFFFMLGGRATFTVNQLKRAQAINYAEAALYETFNRFRVFVNSGGATGWDSTGNLTDETIDIDGVGVIVNYDAGTGEVSATVDYSLVNL